MIIRVRKLPLLCFALLLLNLAASATGYSLAQYLDIQNAANPTFNPLCSEILYRTNISGVPQMWRMAIPDGYQHQVTFDTNGVSGAWWSPLDPNLIVIAAAVGGNERTQLYFGSPDGGLWKRVSSDSTAVYRFGVWAMDGSRFAYSSNQRNKRDFDVYEYGIAEQSALLLVQGEGDHHPVNYSQDNVKLLIEKTYSNSNQSLYLYDGSINRTKLITPHDGDVVYTDPVWDPEGKGFYFICDKDRPFRGVAFWPTDSANFRWVETPEADIDLLALAPDGSWLVWTFNDRGYSAFQGRNLYSDAVVDAYRLPQGVIRSLQFSPDAAKLAITHGTPSKPTDIWVWDCRNDRMAQCTMGATGGIPPLEFREPDLIEYSTFDGRHIPALYYRPLLDAKQTPAIVVVHGGPEGQARPALNGLHQYFLSRGYAILEPNIRGSTGFGKEYALLDNGRKRMDSMHDVEYAARWLAAQPGIDSTRLVVMGGSYGGFATLSQLTTYPDRWAAGVCVVGIANFVTFLENTAAYRRALREVEYGSLAADREFLASISPVNHVDQIKAPLFLIHGANDPRVPVGEATQMATAIRARNGVVEFLQFDDEGHGLAKLKNKVTAYTQVADFLDKHVAKK
ncbi:S9 family peptidase [candidate division KSB1 bacterium]|nr:S9 family peptidase [candidate division KSB1 bacterium]